MPLKLTVAGLWHLGTVTAACSASHFAVIGLDPDPGVVEELRAGRAPIAEPGLDDLLRENIDAGSLRFTVDPAEACAEADVLWACFDTPVDESDVADVDYVLEWIRAYARHLPRGATVLISSQLPAGSCGRLEFDLQDSGLSFAYSPENLRLGKALDVFRHPGRVVIGTRDPGCRERLESLFKPFCDQLLWMAPESAEMAKHALNAFLATSITFTNELARLCEQVGADAKDVERALRTEDRIGPRAYVGPGGAIAGGTLVRDLQFLIGLGVTTEEPLVLLPACVGSNDIHKLWPLRAVEAALDGAAGSTVAVLGLAYKPGTDTLRRSSALELCESLVERKHAVRAFDPAVRALPATVRGVELAATAEEAMLGADAVVVCTEWPEFRQLDWSRGLKSMRRPLVVDPGRFVADAVQGFDGIEYRAVGMPR